MKTNKKNIFNYRPMAAVFVSIMLVICFNNAIFTKNVLSIGILGLLLLGIIVWMAVARKIRLLIVSTILMIMFTISFAYVISGFNVGKIQLVGGNVQGRIRSVSYESGTNKGVMLDTVKVDNHTENYRINITIQDNSCVFDGINVGAIIYISNLTMDKTNLYEDKNEPNTYLLRNNIKYSAKATINDIAIIGTRLTWQDNIKLMVRDRLFNGLSNQNADLAYSAIFGDKSDLSKTLKNAFSASGISHLIAVSGLHIGLIVALITYLLIKCKLKPGIRFVIILALLLTYCFICGFTPSIIRATIMTTVLLGAPLIFRRYDPLSSISFAGIITCAIFPMSVFDIGWLLSFGCVFAICFFSKTFSTVLTKLKVPKPLASLISLSASTQLGIIFIIIYAFSTINTLSIITNLVAVPIFTLAFSYTFVIAVTSLIVPFLSYALLIINPLYSLVILIANCVANINFATITTNTVDYINIVLYTIIIVVCSRFCLVKTQIKSIVACTLLLGIALNIFLTL